MDIDQSKILKCFTSRNEETHHEYRPIKSLFRYLYFTTTVPVPSYILLLVICSFKKIYTYKCRYSTVPGPYNYLKKKMFDRKKLQKIKINKMKKIEHQTSSLSVTLLINVPYGTVPYRNFYASHGSMFCYLRCIIR